MSWERYIKSLNNLKSYKSSDEEVGPPRMSSDAIRIAAIAEERIGDTQKKSGSGHPKKGH